MMYWVWADSDPRKPVATKIKEACERYEQKHGVKPARCLVHPEQVTSGLEVAVMPAKNVPINNFWIEVNK